MGHTETRVNEVCNKIGRLFGEIAASLQGVVEASVLTRPLATLNKEDGLRACVGQLMEERDERGNYFFRNKSHWQAIYRILADRGLCAEGDYTGFERLVWRIQPAGCRVPFSLSALKQITKTGFTRPFDRWAFDPTYFKTRRPYDEMVAVAMRFSEILDGIRDDD